MYRRIFTAVAFLGLIASGGVATTRVSHGQAAGLAYSASNRNITFATDPTMYGGGDQGMDNLYTLDNNICTDGIAITIAHQDMGDQGNLAAHQGHSLELSSIQDYGATAPTLPLGFDSNGAPTAGSSVPIREANGVDNGYTFASAVDNTAGSWQGNVYKAHYGSSGSPIFETVGEQIVGTIVRADHGFVVNEDDTNWPTQPATVDVKSNGDDGRFNGYLGWGGTDDNDVLNNTNNTPPTTPNRDGDWFVASDNVGPTDGSSFDDIIRTDQSPGTGFDESKPNSAPSFMVAPNPDTSRVSDCVIDKNPPQTAISTTPAVNPTTGWYPSPVSVTLTPHQVYYLGGAVTTSYILDGGPTQTYNAPFTVSNGIHTLEYWSADSAGDSEAHTTVTIKVNYNFSGFFSPVDNPTVLNPTPLNAAKAGSSIPINFSLTGNQGLNIFAAGSPTSQQISCGTASTVSTVDSTVTAGNSGLSYGATADQYNYVWKTQKSWANSCREFTATLIDGTTHSAYFKFS